MDSGNARPRTLIGVALVAAALSQGCLVVSLQPAYDSLSLAWDDGLVGRWKSVEDNVEVTVEPGEWRSYRIHYKHPVEESDFTGHLTALGDTYYLDLMPLRGHEYGAALVPAHIILRLARDGERWRVSAIDYDRARAALARGRAGVASAMDERHNVVLTAATPALRRWLRTSTEQDFSAPATFERAGRE
jgi:hypothetical protein